MNPALHQSDAYKGCNDVHFAELLAKHEGIRVSPSTGAAYSL